MQWWPRCRSARILARSGGYRSSGDSHFRLAEGSAITVGNRSGDTKPAAVVHKTDRYAASIGSAAPHPGSGHAVNPSLEARWRHPCRHTVPPPDATPRFLASRPLMGKQCPGIDVMSTDYPRDPDPHGSSTSRLVGDYSPAVPSHSARAANQSPLFPSVAGCNRWCLRACRRGTLSGMDAAPDPTWTYLRRVPRRYARKHPQHAEAFPQGRKTSNTRSVPDVGTNAGPSIPTGAGSKSTRLQKIEQQPPKRPADRSAGRRVCIVRRMSCVTPPQPSCWRPRHAGADATGGLPHPATPAHWLR